MVHKQGATIFWTTTSMFLDESICNTSCTDRSKQHAVRTDLKMRCLCGLVLTNSVETQLVGSCKFCNSSTEHSFQLPLLAFTVVSIIVKIYQETWVLWSRIKWHLFMDHTYVCIYKLPFLFLPLPVSSVAVMAC